MADLIVASLVAIALLAAVIKIIHDKKKKKRCSCGGDCTHCRGCR
ncbi:MAG: FeoB-associated Cys-rich membrane protein [Lachnospiraceae bacterium]|nr:FeoB-associated Cys-rich membrane protein [Lachnospiraceae bacterium]